MRGGLEAMGGRFAEARGLIAEARTIYEELGRRTNLADDCLWIGSDVEMLAGDPAAAEALRTEGCRAFEQMHETAPLSTLASELAEAIYQQGRWRESERWSVVAEAHAASDDVGAQFSWRSVRAKLLARRGETAPAEALARRALRLAAATDALNQHAKVLLDLGEVLGLGDRHEEAAVYVEEALALFERKGNVVGAARARSVLQELAVA